MHTLLLADDSVTIQRVLALAVTGHPFEVVIAKDGQDVNGKSILGLMMLAAGQGSLIEVSASGPDADVALEAIESLIEARFRVDS